VSDLSIRIFESVKGDPTAIQSLAAAIAQNDAARVGEILAARGVALDPAEIATVMSTATQVGSAVTMTFTNTNT
jgi:hypothetical protein